MSTYTERLVIEHKALADKTQKLNNFLHSNEAQALLDEDIALLKIQYSCMEAYLKVLVLRMDKLGLINV